MSKSKDTHVEAAEKAVAAFEAVSVGEAWAGRSDEAEGAVAALRERAIVELFPSELVPIGADLAADLELYTKELAGVGYGQALADRHGRCLSPSIRKSSISRSLIGQENRERASLRHLHPFPRGGQCVVVASSKPYH